MVLDILTGNDTVCTKWP